jgi:hypothetical protein
MSSILSHCFIQGTLEEIRGAWSMWSRGTQDVRFIPAQGGCFLVQLRDPAPRPLMLLQTLTNGHADVLKFKADFESRLVK